MRSKNAELMTNIINFINKSYLEIGKIPTMQEIADALGTTKGTVSNYVAEMKERGLLENDGSYRGVRTKLVDKMQQSIVYLPVVGSIACGTPMLAEENIETYLPVSSDFLKSGRYFVLRACGDSMINAGINDGDLVIIRKQSTAEEGQIIVALIDGEATFKRYYVDKTHKQIRLHPENDNMNDMFFDRIDIQGIVAKVIKDVT